MKTPKIPKFRRVKIEYPPLTLRKWRPPDKPHVATPFKRKPIKRLPEYPKMHAGPHYTLEKIWHEYKVFAKNSCILHGLYAQSDGRFLVSERGKQGPATCFVAIGYTKVLDMSKWTANSICSILEVGTKLYHQSLSINKSCDCTSPKEVHNTYFIEGYQFVMGVDNDVEYKGTLLWEPGQPYFKEELRKVFPRTAYCIVEVEGKFMAVWKDHGTYYIFDPNDRDEVGNRAHECLGIAVVLKFVEFSRMVKHIQTTLGTPGETIAFKISLIYIKKFFKAQLAAPESLSDIVLPPKAPPKPPPKSCLASKAPSKTAATQKIGPIPSLPGSKGVPGKKHSKKEPETVIAVENYASSNTPSFTDLLNEAKLQEYPNLVPTEKPKSPPVTYYQWVLKERMAILIGGCHQLSDKCTKFEGKQSLGNAIAAVGMLRQYKSKLWYPKIIDEILMTGETIYIESRQNFIGDQELNLQNVVETFKINKKVYKHNIDELTLIGQLNSDKDNVLDLIPALKEFFADHKAGILRGPLLLAVWSEDGRYYMFDPNERDRQGRMFEKEYSVEWPDQLVSDPGFACVTWYYSIEDLAAVYLMNMSREMKRDNFCISKIEIKDFAEIPPMWNQYTALKNGKWILRGTFSQNNTRFSPFTRNTQCTVIATMSIIILAVTKCSEWDRTTIDEILIEGDNFYSICVEQLKANNQYVQKQLTLSEVCRKYDYRNMRLKINIEECLINGLLYMVEKMEGIYNLKDGCELFFKENDYGVITSKGLSIAIWKFENHYFYFDSHARDEQGYANCGGVACLLRFENLSEMVSAILANLNPKVLDIYNIGRLDITIWEKTAEGTLKPDFFGYKELSVKKGIIRASTHEGDIDKFDMRAGNQTIANLLTALGMTSVLRCNRWNTAILDQILGIGNQLYEDSRLKIISKDLDNSANWETQEKPIDMDLVTMENVIKDIRIGVNQIYCEIQKGKEGIFEPDKVKRDKAGNVIYQDYELQNLLWNFLEKKKVKKDSKHEIILESEHINIAIWKDDELYYIFDPKGKDVEGNCFGRDLWSAKIVILDEQYDTQIEDIYDQGDPSKPISISTDVIPVENADVLILDQDEEEEEEEDEIIITAKIDICDAKACVIMFTTFDDLYKHIMENVRPNRRIDHFKIYPIILNSTPALHRITHPQDRALGNWYNFEEIEKNKWILRGSIDLRNCTFPEINRGRQYGSMCVSACVYARLYGLPKFKSSTVDYILKYGDKLHTAAQRKKQSDLKRVQGELGLTDDEVLMILRDTTISAADTLMQFLIGNYHVTLEITEKAIEGDVTAKDVVPPPPPPVDEKADAKGGGKTDAKGAGKADPKAGGDDSTPKKKRSRMLTGSIRSKSSTASEIIGTVADTVDPEAIVDLQAPVAMSLKKGIQRFFRSYEFGVLTAKQISVGLWKIFDYYYLFDPESRGPSGLNEMNGTAFIMRFGHLSELIKIVTNNLSTDGSNLFRIDGFSIKSKPAHRKAPSIPAVIPTNPKMTAFHEVNPDKHILRGSFHQDNPKFNLLPNAAGACNAIVALSMAQIHPGETWSKPIVDDVVMNAYRLYKQSVNALGNDFNEWENKMVLETINKEFKIGVMTCNWGINYEGIERGILDIKSSDINNLRKGCEQFFMDFNIGIIQSPPLTVGVWLNKELFYMLDPNPRGSNGLYSTGGTACLLIFKTLRTMVDHFLTNVPPRLHKEEFAIYPVEIFTYETKPKKVLPIKKEDILKVKAIDSLSGYVDGDKPKESHKHKGAHIHKDAHIYKDVHKKVPKVLDIMDIKPHSEFYCASPKKTKSKKTSPKKTSTKKTPYDPKKTFLKGDSKKTQLKGESKKKKDKSNKDPCCCPTKKRLIPHEKIVVDEHRFSPEDKKKWARDKSDAKKLKELQAIEHLLRAQLYNLDNYEAIVRAHYSQNAPKFSFLSRNKQGHANALVAIVMSKLHEPKTWSYKNIEIILESGDVLYKDSYIKYRPTNPLLGLKNIMRTFYIFHLKICTVIYKPYVFGDCRYEDLYVGILNFFMQETAGIIVNDRGSFALAIFQKAGQYYMFDPYDRDMRGEITSNDGCACLMRFKNLENLVEKYLRNAQIDQEEAEVPRFSVCAVSLESVQRITK